MVLKTKCIFDPRSYSDGTRISIMSRHTLDDGKMPDERILLNDERFFWLKEVAPPQKLVGTYYEKLGMSQTDKDHLWKFYENNYIAHLRSGEASWYISRIAECATRETVTILSKELDHEKSDRRILADECKRRFPSLEVIPIESRDAPMKVRRL